MTPSDTEVVQSTDKQKLVIIGNGMAPGRMLEHLLEQAPGRYTVTIFNAEPRVNYDRIMLSPVLAGEKAFADIVINDAAWYAENGLTLHAGRRVEAIDREARVVRAEGGLEAPYDRLILAVGSDPIRLPLPGADLAGVVTFRDLDDVEAMIAADLNRPPPAVDLDDDEAALHDMPDIEPAAFDLGDLERLIADGDALPVGFRTERLSEHEWTVEAVTLSQPVRATLDRSFYAVHSDSAEFWTPGSPAFPAIAFHSTGSNPPN